MRRQIKRDREILLVSWPSGLSAWAYSGSPCHSSLIMCSSPTRCSAYTPPWAGISRWIPTTMSEEDIRKVEEKKKASSYNVKQSKIAIGSGGFMGKGPTERNTNAVRLCAGAKNGFYFLHHRGRLWICGKFHIVVVISYLLFRIIFIAERQRSTFSRCYAYGVASVFFFTSHKCWYDCWLVPVIGIPLPFMSYGGTALITFTVCCSYWSDLTRTGRWY